jgi:hypothetical protein
MDFDQFKRSLAAEEAPAGLSLPLRALWWHAKGDWTQAHDCAQSEDTGESALVHAFLHRVEGDLSNARYWYARAGRAPAQGPLEQEWEALSAELLGSKT